MEKWWVRCGFLGVNINTNINSLRRKKGEYLLTQTQKTVKRFTETQRKELIWTNGDLETQVSTEGVEE